MTKHLMSLLLIWQGRTQTKTAKDAEKLLLQSLSFLPFLLSLLPCPFLLIAKCYEPCHRCGFYWLSWSARSLSWRRRTRGWRLSWDRPRGRWSRLTCPQSTWAELSSGSGNPQPSVGRKYFKIFSSNVKTFQNICKFYPNQIFPIFPFPFFFPRTNTKL